MFIDMILALGTFEYWISQWNTIVGLILVVLGVLIYAFSKRLIMIKNHEDDVDPKDRGVMVLRIAGLVMLLLGLVLVALQF